MLLNGNATNTHHYGIQNFMMDAIPTSPEAYKLSFAQKFQNHVNKSNTQNGRGAKSRDSLEGISLPRATYQNLMQQQKDNQLDKSNINKPQTSKHEQLSSTQLFIKSNNNLNNYNMQARESYNGQSFTQFNSNNNDIMNDTLNKNFIKKSSRSKSRPLNSISGRQDYHSMGYQTGMLPTLGLNRYKNSDIQLGSQNPFTVQMETEKLLIAREREREFKDSNKEEKFALRVFQKSIQTRQNRAGVIREINGIKPQQRGQFHSMTHTEKKNNHLALLDISNDEVNSKKINIFDEINTNQKIGSMLKQDNLIKLTNQNNKQLSLYQNDDQLSASKVSMSQTYSSSNELQPYTNKPKALDYLNKQRENKESTRDFITNARNILVAQISINDKTEETERLKEYIIMEREKLEEAKKTFDEDKDKFQKYMDDLNRKAEETAAEVQKLTLDKNEKIDRITQLVNKIQQKKSNTKQIEEKLMLFKQHKMFLDQLAVSAGKKQAVRRKLTQQQQQMQINNNNADKSGQGSPKKLNRNSKKEMSNFFLTQLNQQGVNIQSKKQQEAPQLNNEFDQELETFSQTEENSTFQEDPTDFEIYFDKYTLLEHLSHLEEDNLFKIHLVQEDEQALERMKKQIDSKIKAKESEMVDVQSNIDMLIQAKNAMQNKQSFLDSNTRVKPNSNNKINTQKGGNGQQQVNQSMDFGSSSDRNNALMMLQQMTLCSKEQINKLSSLISSVLEKVGIKQEDQSDKLEMLRKIDHKLDYLVEAKEHIANGPKRKDLEKKEQELHNQRKAERIERKKVQEQLLQEERQTKNMARIKKQDEFKIFQGKRDMQRARKPDLKPKERNEVKTSEEIIDQFRYIGNKVFEEQIQQNTLNTITNQNTQQQ
eukprot:403353317